MILAARGPHGCNGRAHSQRVVRRKASRNRGLDSCSCHHVCSAPTPAVVWDQFIQEGSTYRIEREIVLDMVETTPSLSTTRVSLMEIGISYSSVWRILDDGALHPFHYQYVQSLKECELCTSSRHFHSGTCSNELQNPNFFEASVLFTDEASFSREGIFNTHNRYSWAAANPHVTRTRAAQDRFWLTYGLTF
ncbi:uncharacterized protein TNCV_1672171 [Trichonephila clavipes]|nr:uncharacterized protein TNCV_1672171 [Trichonephila clavipes]